MTKKDLLNLSADYRRIAWWLYHKENSLVLPFLKRIRKEVQTFNPHDKDLKVMVISPLKNKIDFRDSKSLLERSEEFLTSSIRLQRYLGY